MSQVQAIHKHLKIKSITAIQALNLYGCLRLAARINELRSDGIDVETEMVNRNGKRFARYYLDRGKK